MTDQTRKTWGGRTSTRKALCAAALTGALGLATNVATAAAEDASAVVAAAEARLAVLKKGTATKPPAEGPKAVAGKSIWIISCSQSIELCSDEVNEIAKAGEAIGWKVNVTNAEFDPVAAGDQIRQAVAAKADGIIVFGFDCPAITQPLKEAVSAGVKTLGVVSLDCDDPALSEKSEPLYTVDMLFDDKGEKHYSNFALVYGAEKADITIALSKGKANVLALDVPDLVTITALTNGFKKGLEKCPGCKVAATVDLTTVDQVTAGVVEQKMTTALARNPDADTIFQSTDGLFLTGVQTAIQSSGRNDKLLVVGSEGFLANLDAIRSNTGQDTALAFDARWEAWASIDAMNRAFASAPQAFGGQGYIFIDAKTNMPASGGWDSPHDYRAGFKKVWGR